MLAEGYRGALVFCDTEGNPIRKSNLTHRSFKKILAHAKLPDIRFHDVRHTAATLLLAEGVHPKVVQERLGHASITLTLDTYSHVLPSLQKDATEKLNRLFSSIGASSSARWYG
jgi:integrase